MSTTPVARSSEKSVKLQSLDTWLPNVPPGNKTACLAKDVIVRAISVLGGSLPSLLALVLGNI